MTDPSWVVVVEDGAPEFERVHESLFTVADGLVGTRGAREEDGPGSDPTVVASGLYESTGELHIPALLPCPSWTAVGIAEPGRDRRVLDLRAGVLWRERDTPDGLLRSMRFACIDRPGTVCLRIEGPRGQIDQGKPLSGPGAADLAAASDDRVVASVASSSGGGVAVAACQDVHDRGADRSVERIGSYVVDRRAEPTADAAIAKLAEAEQVGFCGLLSEQRAAWGRLWADADVSIAGDPELERAVRFALFHLLSSATVGGESAVGARGLTGRSYAGHVFWDADVFVLPVLAALRPAAARSMLRYRTRRLGAAKRAAAAAGLDGARFPWESAASGSDVTPRRATDPLGRTVVIRTGDHEEHIVADVAWAAWHYATWVGDRRFLNGPGRRLVMETARYWASRVRRRAEGRAHLYGVVGPDEYHEVVDDNAFTNVMARWNLRMAAELAEAGEDGPTRNEAAQWRRIADALVDGYDPQTGIYEQFAGYHTLEPLLITDVAEPPVAADLLLGRERIGRSQIIKQDDVLMLHHMVPDEAELDSLQPNLAFYGPRTAHGSSLSPAIHAGLLARAGHLEDALRMLRIAACMDLDDLTGSTAGGLHLATMGGLWQALAFGFCGLRQCDNVLRVDPKVPEQWERLGLRLRFRGRRVELKATPDAVTITTDRPLPVELPGAPLETVRGRGVTFDRTGPSTWERRS